MPSSQPVALITGANAGLGRFAALGLVEAGFHVVGTSRDTTGLNPPSGVTLRDLDVTSDESVAALVEGVVTGFGRIDVLVNNAGMGLAGAIEENSIAQQQKLFDINVFGVIRMTNAVLPHMRVRRRGRIVNISSIFGFMPAPYMAAYSATKYAVEGYSESVDHEVRSHGIRVVLVEPGGTRTGFDDNTTAPDNPLEAYAQQRGRANRVVAEQVNGGEDPVTVAKAIVAAATDANPRLRYPAGAKARQLSAMRRIVPARIFDKQLRKTFELAD
ncbi:oxidoreductase [Mycolicibacterium sediminis]|uniref:Short-chain dehydrogenase/reductase n=1 Tax=Mycolicibacterium sediminis TaxID=1286180 RepID=A0A7I7QL15_9MYCO|nr:oxidoreductase [Mycolicibacterium sediminis]BBY27053.1 short-chain dehydrogenase/reductase [Mycolicibacterium sediminis]